MPHGFRIALPELLTFEAIVVILTVGKVNVVLFAIYRPGSQLVSKAFFQELTSILENIMLLSDHVILLGDLNVHVERNDNVNAKLLSNVFDMFSMQNVIKEPTHMHGGTLDLVVPVINMPVTRVRVYPSGVISDHSLVSFCLPKVCSPVLKVKKTVRTWKRVDENHLLTLINGSPGMAHLLSVVRLKNIKYSRIFWSAQVMMLRQLF
ncbi:hypothetical protein HELRODRAFT_165595 [Helobdella robusta]|uniref:Endonuclease/exonuclease/phosphatase domain-containing protein n=1 Tax=Helobdella robusta TaxID=6412 RepID=T1EX20_HELRO|nr:hypothetical protein HELRODRAFT_165595 [Helobdella robusta]ESN91542.1 hypothetical protein HELRODRAFT_165595 [Helobdella robusta]